MPLINGSGALRSFPELPMCSFASNDIPISPLVLATKTGTTFTYTIEEKPSSGDGNAAAAEEPMRAFLSTDDFDNMGGIAFWAMTGERAKVATVTGTLTKAKDLGVALRTAGTGQKVQAVCDFLDSGTILLERGELDYWEVDTSGSLDYLKAFFKDMENTEPQQQYFRIYAVNESLIAWNDNNTSPIAMGPDLICYLTLEGEVFTNADLDDFQGREIAIVGAPPQEATPANSIVEVYLSILHGLGYGGPYVSINALPEPSGSGSGAVRPLPRKRFSERSSKPRVMSWRG